MPGSPSELWLKSDNTLITPNIKLDLPCTVANHPMHGPPKAIIVLPSWQKRGLLTGRSLHFLLQAAKLGLAQPSTGQTAALLVFYEEFGFVF